MSNDEVFRRGPSAFDIPCSTFVIHQVTYETMPSIDPIRFEVMRSAFQAAADEMAAALRKAAYSTNIKTRADFSCALFDDQIRILAQSFSQPIHLASMARLVPLAVNHYGAARLGPGDALVTKFQISDFKFQ